MNVSLSDADLVHASINGQLSAFETLVSRHQDILYRNALYYLRHRDDAQDIVQEAFLKAFQELDHLDDPDKFGSWIRRIARNICFNVLRSQRRARVAQQQIKENLMESGNDNIDNLSIEKQGIDSLRNLLSLLPDKSAQAFTMHYIEELPISTIAQQLNSSVQSIKQRLYRARQQLQQEILKMAKDSFEREKLPDDFPARVIAHLLETGRKDRLYRVLL